MGSIFGKKLTPEEEAALFAQVTGGVPVGQPLVGGGIPPEVPTGRSMSIGGDTFTLAPVPVGAETPPGSFSERVAQLSNAAEQGMQEIFFGEEGARRKIIAEPGQQFLMPDGSIGSSSEVLEAQRGSPLADAFKARGVTGFLSEGMGLGDNKTKPVANPDKQQLQQQQQPLAPPQPSAETSSKITTQVETAVRNSKDNPTTQQQFINLAAGNNPQKAEELGSIWGNISDSTKARLVVAGASLLAGLTGGLSMFGAGMLNTLGQGAITEEGRIRAATQQRGDQLAREQAERALKASEGQLDRQNRLDVANIGLKGDELRASATASSKAVDPGAAFDDNTQENLQQQMAKIARDNSFWGGVSAEEADKKTAAVMSQYNDRQDPEARGLRSRFGNNVYAVLQYYGLKQKYEKAVGKGDTDRANTLAAEMKQLLGV